MKITDNNHLCYSLNVYPGQSWSDKMEIFRKKIPAIRKHLSLDDTTPFGIGLWLDAQTVDELHSSDELVKFQQFLCDNNFYVFTVNAFPYGAFHGTSVKSDVYSPDWTTQGRVTYTNKVADILAELIPDGITGSISTVPGSYKKWITADEQQKTIAENILSTAAHLKELHRTTGKEIALSIEMEPDCLWESPDEFIEFYSRDFADNTELNRYIGVCYDTCHQEFVEGAPGEGLQKLIDANIVISKIQLSAALSAQAEESKSLLEDNFSDEVYLHQTRVFSEEEMKRYPDLPLALRSADKRDPWVIHFHIPIYMTELFGGLTAANQELKKVIEMIIANPDICSNIEIETYTYAVLPESIKLESLEKSISQEYKWLIEHLSSHALC